MSPQPIRLVYAEDHRQDQAYILKYVKEEYDYARRYPGRSIHPFAEGVDVTFATTTDELLAELRTGRRPDILHVHQDMIFRTESNPNKMSEIRVPPFQWAIEQFQPRCALVVSGGFPSGESEVLAAGADIHTERGGYSGIYPWIVDHLDHFGGALRHKALLSISRHNDYLTTELPMLERAWFRYVKEQTTPESELLGLVPGIKVHNIITPRNVEGGFSRRGRREGD